VRPRLHPDAEAEYRAAAEWYDDDYPGRGDRFVDQVEASFARVREAPRSFPFWRRRRDVRACVVPRFPFTVFFVAEPEGVMVYAVAHDKRRPGYWQRRIPPR
jgi:plasmid stabilization system protein ParE